MELTTKEYREKISNLIRKQLHSYERFSQCEREKSDYTLGIIEGLKIGLIQIDKVQGDSTFPKI